MKATKLVIGASLLIALAAVPTASAEPVQNCGQYAENVPGGPETSVDECVSAQHDFCAAKWIFIDPIPRPDQYALCLVGMD